MHVSIHLEKLLDNKSPESNEVLGLDLVDRAISAKQHFLDCEQVRTPTVNIRKELK